METDIYLKRSIFRLNKKFWSKHYDRYYQGRFKKSLDDHVSTLDKEMQTQIEERIAQFELCVSRTTLNKIKDKVDEDSGLYFPLIGDPCYKYNRYVKERFLKNKSCAFLFLMAQEYLKVEV